MFNKNLVPWIVIAILLVFIVVQTCTDNPEPDTSLSKERELQYKRQAAITKIEKDSIQALQARQNKQAQERIRRDSITIVRQGIENRAIRRERDKARVSIQHLIDTIPSLRTYVELSDSLIQHQQQEIDTLKSALAFQVQMNQDLMGIEFAEDKIEAQMQIDCERRLNEVTQERDDAMDQAKKERRKGKFAKILIPVALVGGLILGNSL